MTLDRLRPATRSRAAGALLVSAPMWAWFGVMEFLRPWGSPTTYDRDRGYDVVVDRSLYWLSAGPGSLALLLTGAGAALLLGSAFPSTARWARRLALAAGVLGALSLLAVVVRFDPVATGGRLLGYVVLGSATAQAAVSAGRRGDGDGAAAPAVLAAVAGLTLFLLPLWPLVYAVDLVPPLGAALCFGLVGLGWVAIAASTTRRGHAESHPAARPGRPGTTTVS